MGVRTNLVFYWVRQSHSWARWQVMLSSIDKLILIHTFYYLYWWCYRLLIQHSILTSVNRHNARSVFRENPIRLCWNEVDKNIHKIYQQTVMWQSWCLMACLSCVQPLYKNCSIRPSLAIRIVPFFTPGMAPACSFDKASFDRMYVGSFTSMGF